MNGVIQFTPAELIAICAGALTITAFAEKIVGWFTKVKKPEKVQDGRISDLELQVERNENKLKRQREDIDDLNHCIKTLQRGVYELLGSALEGGNNKAAMQEARDELKQDIFGD